MLAFVIASQCVFAAQAADVKGYLAQLNLALRNTKAERATQTLVFRVKTGTVTVQTDSRDIPEGGTAISVSQTRPDNLEPFQFRNLPLTITHPLHQFPNQFDQAREASGVMEGSVSIEGAGKTRVFNLHKEVLHGTHYDTFEYDQELPKLNEGDGDQGSVNCTRVVGKIYLDSSKRIRRKIGTVYFYDSVLAKGHARIQSATFESASIQYLKLP